jgi:hypothetical protein
LTLEQMNFDGSEELFNDYWRKVDATAARTRERANKRQANKTAKKLKLLKRQQEVNVSVERPAEIINGFQEINDEEGKAPAPSESGGEEGRGQGGVQGRWQGGEQGRGQGGVQGGAQQSPIYPIEGWRGV